MTPVSLDPEDSSIRRAEKVALRLIARAEQNSFGLAAKLERRGFDADVAKAVIARLLDQDLLNDDRYAELWIRSRLGRKKAHSPRWLQISLKKRGIDRNSCLKALEKLLDSETEHGLLLRYLEKADLRGRKNAVYLRRHLKYEGFSPAALDRYFDNSE